MAEKGNETENLSRIKEILFGEDLSSIEERFEEFKKENVEAFHKIKNDFAAKMEEFEKLVNEKQKHVETAAKTSQDFQKTFSEKVEKNITNVNLEFVKEKTKIHQTIQKFEDNNDEKIESLRNDINKSISELKDIINVKFEELSETKIGRKDVADLFQTMADKLKS